MTEDIPKIGDPPKPIKKTNFRPSSQEIQDYLKSHRNVRPKSDQLRRWIRQKTRRNYLKSLPKGRDFSITQSDAPWQVIYGLVKVGGVLAFYHETGKHLLLHQIHVLACHEVAGYEGLYVDGNRIDFPDPWPSWSGYGYKPDEESTQVDYRDKIRFEHHYGELSGSPFPLLRSTLPTYWTTEHRLYNRAAVYLLFKWSREVFGNANLEISFIVRGKKAYDPRTETTYSGQNPAINLADYLTDGVYGLGYSWDDIDIPTLIEAANACDAAEPLKGGGTEPRFQMNGAFTVDQSPDSIINEFEKTMAGHLVFSGGKWKFYAGVPRTPVMTLGMNDLRGPVTVRTMSPRDDVVNCIRGTYISTAEGYISKDFPATVVNAYVTEDNGSRRWLDVDYPFVQSVTQAQRLARIELEASRRHHRVSATFGLRAMELEPGDWVALNLPRYGYDGTQTFEVQDTSIRLVNDEEMQLDVTLREMDSQVFAWDADENEQDVFPSIADSLGNPLVVESVSALAMTSGTSDLYVQSDGTIISRIHVTWDIPDDALLADGGHIELQYKRNVEPSFAHDQTLLSSTSSTYLEPVEDGRVYEIRVRCVNALGAKSDWTTGTHTVIGKTAPPSDVTGFLATINEARFVTFDWDPVTDFDLRLYEIREGADWGSGTAILRTNETHARIGPVSRGVYHYWLKAMDTTGNMSTTPAAATINASFPPNITGLTYDVNENGYFLEWDPSPIPDLQYYEVRRGSGWDTATPIDFPRANKVRVDQPYGTFTYWLKARDADGDYSMTAAGAMVTFDAVPNVGTISHEFLEDGAWLKWPEITTYQWFNKYIIKAGSTWDTGTIVGYATNGRFPLGLLSTGAHSYLVKTLNTWGAESLTATPYTLTIATIAAPSVSVTQQTVNLKLSWSTPSSQYKIREYEIRRGSSWDTALLVGRLSASTYTLKIDWLGAQTFLVAAIDIAGNVGTAAAVSFSVVAPSAVRNLTSQSINERVLLDWDEPTTHTLPIDHYNVLKGATFGEAIQIYRAAGTFAPTIELTGGSYTYWIVAVDTNGNEGAQMGTTMTVLPPVDFIIRDDQVLSPSAATKTNVLVLDDGASFAAPVNTTQTWLASFGSYNSLQDEIDAGFLYYLEPSETTATVLWTVDYGVALSSSTLSLTWLLDEVDPAITVTPNIQTSMDGTTYTNQGDVAQAFVQSFRYAKYKLTVTGDTTAALAYLNTVRARVTLKKSTDSGVANVVHTDTGGTVIAFNLDFLDIDSVQATPVGTLAKFVVINFDFSTVNPVSFKVLLFDIDGARVDGVVTWSADGALDVLGVS